MSKRYIRVLVDFLPYQLLGGHTGPRVLGTEAWG